MKTATPVVERPPRNRRETTLTVKAWGPEQEAALGVLRSYLGTYLHVDDCTTKVVTWAVKTLAAVVRSRRGPGWQLSLPGATEKPIGKLPRVKLDKDARDRIMVVGWSEAADAAMDELREWAAEDLNLSMTGNKVAAWAVLTLADMIRAYWSGKEVMLPTAETAHWEGFRQL